MPRVVEKEIIRPGSYWYIDESTGLPARANFSQQEVLRLHKDGKDMLAAGLSIPVPLEHQRNLRAMTAAEKAAADLRHNAGEVQDYLLKKVKNDDGSEVEALFGKVRIEDADIDKKLGGAIKWTSPWISSFTDGNGRSWKNVVTHLALTTRPRITAQLPFPSISAAMSLAANLVDKKVDVPSTYGGGVLLSRAGLLREKAGAFSPASPMAFSLFSGVRLAADEMPPKKPEAKKPEGKPPEGKPPEGKPPAEGDEPLAPEMQGQTEPLVDPDGDIAIYDVVTDLLEALGIPIQPGNEDDFCERLYQAVMEKVKGKVGESDMATPAAAPATPPAKPPLTPEPPPLFMSLEDAHKITDPTMRSIALSNIELRSKFEKLEKNALESARKYRQARVERLAQRVKPAVKDMLLAKLAGATFSLGEDGAVRDSLDDTLTMLEASIPDMPALLLTDAAALSVQPHPKEYEGEMSAERTKEVVDQLCKAGGVPEPRKAS